MDAKRTQAGDEQGEAGLWIPRTWYLDGSPDRILANRLSESPVFPEIRAKVGGAIKHGGIVLADLNAKAACALCLSSVPPEGQVHILWGGYPDVLPS